MKKSSNDTAQDQGRIRRSRDTRYRVADLLERVLGQLHVVSGPDDRGEHVAWCIFHPDGHGKPPHQPNLYVSERGFKCHACGKGGSLKSLAKYLGIWAPAGQPQAIYDYKDEQGNLLYQVLRYRSKRFVCRRPDGSDSWIWSLKGTRRVLYRLRELITNRETQVYVVEGEKDADALAKHGLVATTKQGGAGRWRDEYSRTLAGREVVVIPDKDVPGHKQAEEVALRLRGVARSVKVLHLPGLQDKGDVSDWLNAGHSVSELQRLAKATPQFTPAHGDGDGVSDGRPTGKPSQADRIIWLLSEERVTLFCDETSEPYASVPVNGHSEIWHCGSEHFRDWLAGLLWRREQKAPSCEGMNSALNVIRAKAKFEGEEHVLHNRVAWLDGAIWYDLADAKWRAVKVTPEGWEVVCDPPVLFRRYVHQERQVEPAREACNLKDLLRFINIQDESQGYLLLVYVVACLVPDIPHPVLVLHGPQGSAKTTALRMLRRLIDPSIIEVLTLARDDKELIQNLSHHWAPYFDNVTKLSGWVSDALCRAVTGDGSSKRKLFSNSEDVIQRYRRCIGLSSINVAAQQPDLVDRCLLIGLERIGEEDRKTEQELWSGFERMRPRVFSGVLSTLSRSLALLPSIKQPQLPRMADFAYWGCAIAEALGWTQEGFLEAFRANAKLRDEEVLESSVVARVVVAFMEDKTQWEGTASELLAELENVADSLRISTKARGWPGSPNVLSWRVNEVETNLAASGIKIFKRKGRQGRKIILLNIQESVASCDGVDEPETTKLRASSTGNPRGYAGRGDVDDGDDASLFSEGKNKIEVQGRHKSPHQEVQTKVVHSVHSVINRLIAGQAMGCRDGGRDDIGDAVDGRIEVLSTAEGQPDLRPISNRQLPAKLSDWPETYKDAYEERAAIMEFDGGLSREDAEKWADTILRRVFAAADGDKGDDTVCGDD